MISEAVNPEIEIIKDTQWGSNFVVIVSTDAPVCSIATKTQWGSNFIINIKVNNLEHADEIAEKVANKVIAKLRQEAPLGSSSNVTTLSTLGSYQISVVNRLLKSIWNSPLSKALR